MAAIMLADWSKQAYCPNCAQVLQRMVELENARTESSHRAFLQWWDAPRRTRLQSQFQQLLWPATCGTKVTNVVLLGFQLQPSDSVAAGATRVKPWVAGVDTGKEGT